jgi:nucleoside diphosphate kinase
MARFETERTYVMIKPDGVQRGVVGNIISRFEAKGFVLKGLKLFQCPKALAEEHYTVSVCVRQVCSRARVVSGRQRCGLVAHSHLFVFAAETRARRT